MVTKEIHGVNEERGNRYVQYVLVNVVSTDLESIYKKKKTMCNDMHIMLITYVVLLIVITIQDQLQTNLP